MYVLYTNVCMLLDKPNFIPIQVELEQQIVSNPNIAYVRKSSELFRKLKSRHDHQHQPAKAKLSQMVIVSCHGFNCLQTSFV